MSVSDENTNELDSYGVWVKHSSGEENLSEAANEAVDETAVDDSLDLPDFDDSDFSDMFKDDGNAAAEEDFGGDLDSTLSADELANITSGDISFEETPPVETPTDESLDFEFEENIPENDPAEDFVEEKTPDVPVEESISDDIFTDESFQIDEPAEEQTDSQGEEEISMDEFGFDENSVSCDEAAPSENSGEDEEISLDDFMDGGFSDESVASGNNGFEEGKQPESSVEEEISLDDFVDMSSFDNGPSPDAPKEEEIVEEAPLDMDISFDDSADAVETEENLSVESIDEDDDTDVQTEVSTETEEVSLDDFGSNFETSSESKSEDSLDTEEIDLSDFGIDAEAEETPIVQDVEEAKNKEVVVDYDLSVGDEDTSAAPVVSEVVSNNNVSNDNDIETFEGATPVEVETVAPGSEVVSSSLLQQIVNDLSGLKDEINQLKSNLAEIKAGEVKAAKAAPEVIEDDFQVEETAVEETPVDFAEATPEEEFQVEETAVEEPAVIENEPVFEETNIDEEIIPETDNGGGGFFDLDDSDETIALSGDELDNIFNSAQFSETPIEEPSDLSFNAPIEEETVEQPAVEEEIIDESEADIDTEITDDLPNEIPAESFVDSEAPVEESIEIEESFVDEQTDDSLDLPNEIPVSDEVTVEPEDTEADSFNEIAESEEINTDEFNIKSEEETIEETINDNLDESLTNDEEINFDFEDEKLEEPEFGDEIAVDEGDEELPDEISIPKSDDILVETNDSDFMDSVKDSTEIEEEAVETEVESVTVEAEPAVEEEIAVEAEADDAFDTVDTFLNDGEPVVEETAIAPEEVFEESAEVTEETVVSEPEVAESSENFEIDNLNNDLTESNIDYLTTKDDTDNSITEQEETESVNSDLKKDIKSVLLYMDQLLENLPEEKIIEFAKSDEFTTYKKLFSELGLS